MSLRPLNCREIGRGKRIVTLGCDKEAKYLGGHIYRRPWNKLALCSRHSTGNVEDATGALDACDREQKLMAGRRPGLLVYRAIWMDEDVMHWPAEDIGTLRLALNTLARVFRLAWYELAGSQTLAVAALRIPRPSWYSLDISSV
jgi:hypothetical protein